MRFDKLTSSFQQALADAQSLALGCDHAFIEPVHLMKALLEQDGGTVRPLLMQAGVSIEILTNKINQAIDARVNTTPNDLIIVNTKAIYISNATADISHANL